MIVKRYISVLSSALLVYSSGAFACTGIRLKTTKDTYVYARTLEFADDIASKILFIPRKYPFEVPAPGKKKGLVWTSAYAVVGASAYGSPYFVDGVNEKGLAGGLFYFPGYAQYEEVTPDQYRRSVPMWALLTWLLTTCKTVSEVKKVMETVHVSAVRFPGNKQEIPVHVIMHDESGSSVVIEYMQGKLFLHDNPLGVFTNAPSFDWHMTNLRNYSNLTAHNVPEKTPSYRAPLGQGSGMHGLPGDFTPPSRFVRAALFTQAAPRMHTELKCVYQAFHILNNFDIPQGSVISRSGALEYTQWTSAVDMKNKIFYWRSYTNFQLQKIELTRLDLDAPTYRTFSLQQPDVIHDLTTH